MADDSNACACAVISRSAGSPVCQPYNEPAFRYFLDLERKRARRTGRSLLLLLVHIDHLLPVGDGPGRDIVARRLFLSLRRSVRNVDFIGWFRTGRVAGAALTECARLDPEMRRAIRRRVGHALRPLGEARVANQTQSVHLHTWVLGSGITD